MLHSHNWKRMFRALAAGGFLLAATAIASAHSAAAHTETTVSAEADKALSIIALNKAQTQAVVTIVSQAKADGLQIDRATDMQIKNYADGSVVVAFSIGTIEKDGKPFKVFGAAACPAYAFKDGKVSKLTCLDK